MHTETDYEDGNTLETQMELEVESIPFDRIKIFLHTIVLFPAVVVAIVVTFIVDLLMAGVGMTPSGYAFSLCAYSGLLHITYLLKLRQRQGILLTDRYLDDNSCVAASGRIQWSEVFDAQPIDGFMHKGIAVFIEDRDALYLRHRLARRWLLKANEHICGSPVHVSTDCLAGSRDDLLESILMRLQRHRERADSAPPLRRFGSYAPREEYLVPYVDQSSRKQERP